MTFVSPNTMKYLALIIMLLWITPARSAFEKPESGPAIARGNACVAVPGLSTALFYNPALMDSAGNMSVYMAYRNFYALSEIRQIDLILNLRILPAPAALGVSFLGTDDYQELQFLTGLALELFSGIQIGMGIQYYFLSISGYGADYSIGFNWGIHYEITPNLYCGAMAVNLNKPYIGRKKEKLPQSFSLGLCYIPYPNLSLNTEIYKDIRFEPELRMGVSYQFDYPLIIRIGFQDNVNSYALGLGTILGSFCFDYTVNFHSILGISHIISFSFGL